MSSDREQIFTRIVVIVCERTYTERIPHAHLDAVALASASPRRRELLASLGLRVTVIPSAYDELPLPGVHPVEVALRHARGKAAAAAPSRELIVAADTVV